MERKKIFRWVSLFLIVAMVGTALMGCTGSGKKNTENSAEKTGDSTSKEPLEYSFYYASVTSPVLADEANDVVTKEIEKKFNIKVKEVFYNQGMSISERMNLFIASNSLPDVVKTTNDNVTVPQTGRYAELGDMIKQNCPNYLKYFPENEWGSSMYNGKMYAFSGLFMDGTFPQFKDDPYVTPNGNWAGLWTTENILKKLGYKFTPNVDIIKKVNSTGKPATYEDFKIEPAIDTPDAFYNFLKKIKENMPQVNGKDIIPFSMPVYLEPHLGAMFGVTSAWKYNPDTKQVSQFLGDENAKAYWKFMNKLYNEGLLDKDFAVQKDEQLQEKGVQQRVAVSMTYKDLNLVQAAIRKADPNDYLRMIPMPHQPGTTFVGIDGVSKATYRFFINKDFKDIPRLLKYFDWCLSPEAAELKFFGPESLGLYEMKDGKKVFKNEEIYKALLSGNKEYLKQNYDNKGLATSSKAFYAAPYATFYENYWKRSYPVTFDENNPSYNRNYVSTKGLDWKGYLAQAIDDETKKVIDFTNGEFQQLQSSKLFAAKNDEEFDKAWEEMQKIYKEKLSYDEAKKKMETVFKMRGFEVK